LEKLKSRFDKIDISVYQQILNVLGKWNLNCNRGRL